MSIFSSIFETVGTMGPQDFITCIGSALAAGLILAGLYMFRNRHTDSMAVTIALLPAIVSVVIMAVSGDIGAGIAVAGAFSLVRFRSAPGSARDIAAIFIAMAAGLLIGMGFIAYALLFSVIIGLVFFALNAANFGGKASGDCEKTLRITIPEDLDYNSEIDSVIGEYTVSHELTSVRSVNMGSMFKLTYKVSLKDPSKQKEFIDRIRVRNGNLEVALMHQEAERNGL